MEGKQKKRTKEAIDKSYLLWFRNQESKAANFYRRQVVQSINSAFKEHQDRLSGMTEAQIILFLRKEYGPKGQVYESSKLMTAIWRGELENIVKKNIDPQVSPHNKKREMLSKAIFGLGYFWLNQVQQGFVDIQFKAYKEYQTILLQIVRDTLGKTKLGGEVSRMVDKYFCKRIAVSSIYAGIEDGDETARKYNTTVHSFGWYNSHIMKYHKTRLGNLKQRIRERQNIDTDDWGLACYVKDPKHFHPWEYVAEKGSGFYVQRQRYRDPKEREKDKKRADLEIELEGLLKQEVMQKLKVGALRSRLASGYDSAKQKQLNIDIETLRKFQARISEVKKEISGL